MAPEHPYQPAYKSAPIVWGLLFLALGIGNWLIGSVRVRPHEDYLRENPAPVLSTESLKAALLQPPDERREERSISRAKRDFYELVRTGGRLLVVTGSLCLLAGAFSLGRRTLDNVTRPGGASRPRAPERSILP